MHPKANTSCPVSSRSGRCDERAGGSVDQVDDDRVRDAPAVDRGTVSYLHMDVKDTDLAAPGRSGP